MTWWPLIAGLGAVTLSLGIALALVRMAAPRNPRAEDEHVTHRGIGA